MQRRTLIAPFALAPVALALSACAGPEQRRADGLLREGLVPARLDAFSERVRSDVAAGLLPGGVVLVMRNGKVAYQDAIGMANPKTGTPMQMDSIFRIASLTKPIVSVAVMMLVEEGKVLLSDPITKYLPQLAGLKVGIEKPDANGKVTLELVPAMRAPTIHDLLRHTSGFTYGFFGQSLVKDQYTKGGVDSRDQTNLEFIRRLAQVPLIAQPGSVWEYSRSTDVLGAMLEAYSGETLDVYLERRILKPLKMHDSGFWVADPAKQSRIADPFAIDPDSKAPAIHPEIRKPPKLLAGGDGMVSTALDYARFAQMLLNGGELDGVRLLSRKTIDYMSSDHLGDLLATSSRLPGYLPGPGHAFGLGFATRIKAGESPVPGSVGDYSWIGLFGTYFWIDPKEDMIAVWMSQQVGRRAIYRTVLRDTVYGALVR